jgi:glycosyltransferase involved in cell wall biosynthesis
MIPARAIDGEPPPRFSIIVPAHNEEQRIGQTLEGFAEAFNDSEIIVVLNGCTDDTQGVVERIRRKHANVHIVGIPGAVGKGGAVRAGFLIARAGVVGYVDADGSTPAREMRRICESIGSDDGVIASRWLPDSHVVIKQPFVRRMASRCFNLLVRMLFGLHYSDTQCGAKVFRKDALDLAMRAVETTNLAFDVDVLFAMKSAGMRVKEVPTYWVDMTGSKVRLVSASTRMLAAILRLRLQYSMIRLFLPIFDRLFPTNPARVHDRLRILILNWRDPKHPQSGGAETYLFEQARRWVKSGHYVEWLTAGFRNGAPRDVLEGIRIRRVGNAMTVYAALPWAYLREFRDRFDVVLDASNGIPFFSPLFSMKPKICIVHHVHREVFRKHLPAWLAYPLIWCEEKLVPLLYRNVRFVAVSDDTRDEMTRLGIGGPSIGLVRNGVDGELVPGTKSATPVVAYLGRLKAYKRVDLLVEAFARVREQLPDATLRIAGTGDARPALEECVRRLGLERSVAFEGFVDEDRKRALLQEAWVLVTPSEMEGWGISVIEANACATPAVAFAVPGLREAIVDGVSGLLVPEGGDLAAAIALVLGNASLRERLERGAVERARAFSWEISANEMLAEMMRAMVGGEFHAIDLDGNWTFMGSPANAGTSFVLSRRSTLDAIDASAPSALGEALEKPF